jgi:hypothetical protein
MKHIMTLAAVAEMATGLALIAVPSVVGQLLLGVPLAGPAATVAGVLGVALLALGLACWPGPPRLGMVVYSTFVTLYLAYAGFVRPDRTASLAGRGAARRTGDCAPAHVEAMPIRWRIGAAQAPRLAHDFTPL